MKSQRWLNNAALRNATCNAFIFQKEILLNESQSMATETLAEGRPAKP